MSPLDQKTFFRALAFATVLSSPKRKPSDAEVQSIESVASLMEAFCADNSSSVFAEEKEVQKIDSLIAVHIEELRQREETVLPVNRELLIKMLDRLLLREVRRKHENIYATASVEELQDRVLPLLDRAINRMEG